MIGFLGKIFKSSNQRRVDGYAKVVNKINSHEKSMAELSEDHSELPFRIYHQQIQMFAEEVEPEQGQCEELVQAQSNVRAYITLFEYEEI